MIRLCHVQLFPLMSGVQRSMLEIFAQLDRSRYQVEVVCKEPGPLTQELARLNIPVHFAPSLRRGVHPWRDYRAYRELRRIFRQNEYQIVHTHSSKPGFLGRIAARHAGVPIVIHHVRGFAFNEAVPQPRHGFYRQLERYAAEYCDCLLFVNREERDLVVAARWLPADNCITVYNGVDLTRVHPDHRPQYRAYYRASWAMSDDEFVILFMGRLEYPKQPLLIAEIAARLEHLRPRTPWRLIVAGSGPEQAHLEQAIKTASLDHRVRLLGWQEDPTGVLHAADVVLLTSLVEGLPRSLIEAQAAGLPIVAGQAKGVREVVIDGTGFLCSPKKPAEYVDALIRLIDHPPLRATLGQAARWHAEQCFDTVANNRKIVAVYESLLEP